MKITRQNYEHWFIDFIEGNLNPADEAMVRKFVQLNPDLSSELEDISEFTLVPELNKYEQKNLLKQNPLKAIDDITKFERLSIAYLENDLDENEQVELDQLIENSKKKRKEFHLIQKTKLLVDTSIGYNKKDSLKKLFIVPSKSYNYKLIYRVAAAFILLLGLTIVFNQKPKKELVGKQLSKLYKKTYLREPIDNKTLAQLSSTESKYQFIIQKSLVKEEKRPSLLVPDRLNANKCTVIGVTDKKKSRVDATELSILASNNSGTKIKASFAKSLLYVANARRKEIGAKISAAFKQNFKYKKINTEDGRTLIALKAGDMEYIVNKKQRNK